MSVPHKVSRAKLNSLLIQRIISQQKQARDAEVRLDEALAWKE